VPEVLTLKVRLLGATQSVMVWLEDVVNDLAEDALEDPSGRHLETGLMHAIEAACDTTPPHTAQRNAAFRQAKDSRSVSGNAQAEAAAPQVITGQLTSRIPRKQREFAIAGGGDRRAPKYADLVWDELEEADAGALLSVARG
jgi:hypothetical protein